MEQLEVIELELIDKEKKIGKINNYNEMNLQKINCIKEKNDKLLYNQSNLETISKKDKLEHDIKIENLNDKIVYLEDKIQD